MTATSISVGIFYATNSQAFEAQFGNTAVTSGDTYHYARLIVQDINAHGGIAGRRLVPVYHAYDATTTETSDQSFQAECADFTQDHHVFAVVPGAGFSQSLDPCVTKAGAVIGTLGVDGTGADFDNYPSLFDVTAISLDRMSRNLVSALVHEHYFTPWDTTKGKPGALPVKVGIIMPDRRSYTDAVAHALVPALAASGIQVSKNDIAAYYSPQSQSDVGRTLADIQSAVLRFRSDNVTHVLPLETNAQVFFARDAENQHYRPRYGVNSASGTQAYAGNLLPPAQLNGALGLGYLPLDDLPADLNPDNGPYSNERRRHCVGVMKAGGQGSFSSPNAEADALGYCDLLYTLRDVISRIPRGQAINQGSFAAALAHIGNQPSASLPQAFYGPHHHDAVTVGWYWGYFSDCTCMHYMGNRFTLR